LDTDVFSWIAWSHGRHEEFTELVRGHILVVAFATVGELWAGAEKANWGHVRRQKLEDILTRYVVLPGTDAVTRQWGRIAAQFKGQIGENDMWIAACAQTNQLPIVTGNLTHFAPIASKFSLTLVHPDL